MPATAPSRPDIGRSHVCGNPGCAVRVHSVTLSSGKGSVAIDEEPATVVYTGENTLMTVTRTPGGLVGGVIPVAQAKGMLAARRPVYRQHACAYAGRR